MRMGRLITAVNTPVEAIESEIGAAYLRLATSAGTARYRQRHYLDGQTAGTLFGTVTALTAAYPWALDDFGAPAWAAYQPDPQAPPPDGLRVGMLRIGEDLPPMPAVARFAGHGHLLISECGFAGGAHRARSLLQALTLRLATATRPGTVRFALADPVGQGRQLSAFLRLPAHMRVGSSGVGVAASPAETEALLTTLTSHVVEVTQTRLTNVYDSVEAYNAATTGGTGAKSVQSGAGRAIPSGPGSNSGVRGAVMSRSKLSGRSGRTLVSTSSSAFIRSCSAAVLSSASRCTDSRCSCWRTRSSSFSRCLRSRASRSSSRRCAARRCSNAARFPLRAIAPLVCVTGLLLVCATAATH